MKLKNILALLLVSIMITAVFTGCNQTAKSPFVSSDPAATASPTEGTDASASPSTLNLAGAYASLAPTTVMMTINGNDVTWDELFYYINYAIYDIQSQGDSISDWSAVITDDMTYKDYVLESAANFALQYMALKYGAEQLKVTLTDDDKTAIQADWDQRVSDAGSEEAFIAQLQALYCSKDLYLELSGYSRLAQGCFASMYGTDGNKLTDEEVADNTAQDGYLMAKHILMLTTITDESGNSTPLSDTEKAEVLKKMENILSQLKGYTGADFDAFFDEQMNEFSEDKGGVSMFPDGYLFQSADMVSAFSDAATALDIGKFSDIVESEFGYHIIYRLPLNYDVTPMAYSNSGTYSLRYITAQNMFGAVADTWMNSLTAIYSDQYKSLDFTKMFAVG